MSLIIRKETDQDHLAVAEVVRAAFESVEDGEPTEHLLVERLRRSKAFVPALSIVAEQNGTIVGHILLTEVQIQNGDQSTKSLALAPLSVHPDFQGQGIGGRLMGHAQIEAEYLGYGSIIVLGHSDYYLDFGYQLCSDYGISLPFDAPPENCMALELVEGALQETTGEVVYDPAFFQ
jgi:predicted N-acetyltransferase YhbS